MAKPTQKVAEVPARGVYPNGGKLWLRTVSSRTRALKKSKSTGTRDVARANRIAAFNDDLSATRENWDILDRILDGDLSLSDAYDAHVRGALNELRAAKATRDAAAADADLEPLVAQWHTSWLPKTKAKRQKTRDMYLSEVRHFIPAGVRFPASTFTTEHVTDTLAALDASSGTRRRYYASLHLFYQYAAGRVHIPVNPFANSKAWRPENAKPKSVFWAPDVVQRVLALMTGEHKVAMTLFFGSGVELGALKALTGRTVSAARGENVPQDQRWLVTRDDLKNSSRDDRLVYVDAWAWPTVAAYRATLLPGAPLWTITSNWEKELRHAFYEAQVAAGLIKDAPKNPDNYVKQWGTVKGKHGIHEARHTWAITRRWGLDGEPEVSDIKWLADNLGHADEQMVLRVYTNLKGEVKQMVNDLRRAVRQRAEQSRAA